MRTSQLTALLHRSEGETLDFKRDQYPFVKATDEERGELLKDLLAMANAWKESDGYIVIGVEEEHGRAKRVCGATASLEDASLQQFVKSRTNRPVSFLVEVLPYNGVNITVITINKEQRRPIFLPKGFGQLKANVVYIRRGSSTAEAAPDEIADMGRGENAASEERERNRAKKEKQVRFWRDFKDFLGVLEKKATWLNSMNPSCISDSILSYRLPLDSARDFLREVRELDLDVKLRKKLEKVVEDIREIDDYMNLGAAKFKEWHPNLRNTIENLYISVLEMKKQFA